MPKTELARAIERWLADPESDVGYAEFLDGRWAVRMSQTVRDATTVWWTEGEKTLRAEAYVLPAPPARLDAVYRLCLKRNADRHRAWFALDSEDAVVIRARVPNGEVDAHVLDAVLGEIYLLVETTFPQLAKLAFEREKTV